MSQWRHFCRRRCTLGGAQLRHTPAASQSSLPWQPTKPAVEPQRASGACVCACVCLISALTVRPRLVATGAVRLALELRHHRVGCAFGAFAAKANASTLPTARGACLAGGVSEPTQRLCVCTCAITAAPTSGRRAAAAWRARLLLLQVHLVGDVLDFDGGALLQTMDAPLALGSGAFTTKAVIRHDEFLQ